MLRQEYHQLEIPTPKRGLYDITSRVSPLVRGSKLALGLATLHILHTSASLLIQENADPDVRADLERFFGRLVPDGDPLFEHTAEGSDDMPAHIRTALTCVNLSLPIARGALVLGTWQGIYLWEHRTHPHQRTIAVHLIGE